MSTSVAYRQDETFDIDTDVERILEFIEDAEVVEGPEELYTLVAQLRPDLLHKMKPPLSLMH